MRGVTLRRDPAREECFTVVDLHKDLWDFDDMSDISRRQRLHRHMHNEMQTLEIVAQNLADFPEAPWELRMELARQCWDESRHSAILYRRLREIGGRKGEFPVMNYEWGVTQMLDSLPARLARPEPHLRGRGDGPAAAASRHVERGGRRRDRRADGWPPRPTKCSTCASPTGGSSTWRARIPAPCCRLPGVQLQKVTTALAPEAGEVNAVGVNLTEFAHVEVITNVDDRRLAEFTEAEIAELLRKEGFSGPGRGGCIVPVWGTPVPARRIALR